MDLDFHIWSPKFAIRYTDEDTEPAKKLSSSNVFIPPSPFNILKKQGGGSPGIFSTLDETFSHEPSHFQPALLFVKMTVEAERLV